MTGGRPEQPFGGRKAACFLSLAQGWARAQGWSVNRLETRMVEPFSALRGPQGSRKAGQPCSLAALYLKRLQGRQPRKAVLQGCRRVPGVGVGVGTERQFTGGA